MISGMWCGDRRPIRSQIPREPRSRRGDLHDRRVGVVAGESRGPGSASCSARRPPTRGPSRTRRKVPRSASALNEKVRPCRYMIDDVDDGTSATGARFDVDAESLEGRAGRGPLAARDRCAVPGADLGGESVGGAHGIRLTDPPSWSTAMMKSRLTTCGCGGAQLRGERPELSAGIDVRAEEDRRHRPRPGGCGRATPRSACGRTSRRRASGRRAGRGSELRPS